MERNMYGEKPKLIYRLFRFSSNYDKPYWDLTFSQRFRINFSELMFSFIMFLQGNVPPSMFLVTAISVPDEYVGGKELPKNMQESLDMIDKVFGGYKK